MKVQKDEFLIDARNSAVMTMRWQTVQNMSCSNRKGTAANSRQFDGRYDQAAGTC